jgi:hypothetical protein
MSLLIDSRTHTRAAVQVSIEDYLATLPDWERWKDMFESSVGKIIIDLLAGITELHLFKADTRLQENYLYTAMTKESVYLLADLLGYKVNRKSAAEGKVTLSFDNPLISPATLPDGYLIYEGTMPLSLVGNYTINVGESSKEMDVAQGEYVYKLFTATPDVDYYLNDDSVTTSAMIGTAFERLILDEGFEVENASTNTNRISIWVCTSDPEGVLTISSAIPWYDNLADLDSDSCYARTYYEGGITILFGDDTFGKRIYSSDLILVKYMVTQGSSATLASGESLGDIIVDTVAGATTGSLAVSDTITGGADEDDIEKVRTVTTGYFSAQERAVTITDWEYIALSYQGVTSVQVQRNDDYCCTVELCAVTQTMEDENHYDWSNPDVFWSSVREAAYLEYLDEFKMITTQALIIDPIPIDMEISLTVTLNNSSIDTDALNISIESAVLNWCYELGKTFYPTQLIQDISDLNSYISRVEVNNVVLNDVEQSNGYTAIPLVWGTYLRSNSDGISISFSVQL